MDFIVLRERLMSSDMFNILDPLIAVDKKLLFESQFLIDPYACRRCLQRYVPGSPKVAMFNHTLHKGVCKPFASVLFGDAYQVNAQDIFRFKKQRSRCRLIVIVNKQQADFGIARNAADNVYINDIPKSFAGYICPNFGLFWRLHLFDLDSRTGCRLIILEIEKHSSLR